MTAIYARQSVERADSISIESQIEHCEYEAKGDALKTYIDRGYSGKNTDRPAYSQMMTDMENGLISKVIVYKLDRISRSILDFSNMMELFEQYGVEFVSTAEKFDTSSPMGRAMLNICIVFAQLERETIQKRVADAYRSRSQKSFYMGGKVPYGFRLEPTVIDGVKTSKYVVHPQEAGQVRLLYELYAEPGTSYGDIVNYFAARGITKNGRPWGRTRLAEILRNPIYARADLSLYEFYRDQGVLIANDPADFIGVNGCYYYRGGDRQGSKQQDLTGDRLVLAPHEGIVSSRLWLKCRVKCLASKQAGPCQKAKNTWLAGKIKCGECGYALVDKRYRAGKSRYLLCSNRMNAKSCQGPGTIYSDDLERIVYDQMRKKLEQFPLLSKRTGEVQTPELTALNLQRLQVESEIDSLLGKLPQADAALFAHINRRIGELDERKRQIAQRLCDPHLRRDNRAPPINNHLTDWDNVSFEDKRRIVDLLIRVVHATGENIRIEWRL